MSVHADQLSDDHATSEEAEPQSHGSDALQSMSRSFGADLSGVTVERHSQSSPLVPLATTRGSRISLASSLDVGSAAGREVLGHEVSHVLQQRAGRVRRSAGRTVDLNLEREATTQGRVAAVGGQATIRGRRPNDDQRPTPVAAPEQPWVPALILRIGIGFAADKLTDAVEEKATKLLTEKAAAFSEQAQQALNEVSPSASFLLRNGPGIIKAYGYWKEFLGAMGGFGDDAEAELIKQLAEQAALNEGHPGMRDTDIQLLVKSARITTDAAFGLLERYALNIFEEYAGEAVDLAQEVAQKVIAITGGVTELTNFAREGAEWIGAAKWLGRKGAVTQATKAAAGKKTTSEKVDQATARIDEENERVQNQAAEIDKSAGELRGALGPRELAARHDKYLEDNLAGIGGAGYSGMLAGVNAAVDAFYTARKEGVDPSEILSRTHAAGGDAFIHEFLGSLVEDGGKLLVIKGVVYCIPGVGAVAEPLADAAGAIGGMLFDIYGDQIAEGTLWAIQNPEDAAVRALGFAVWAGDLTVWAAANKQEAAWLGVTNIASTTYAGAAEFASVVIKYAGMLVDTSVKKVVDVWEDPREAAKAGLKQFGGKVAKYAAMAIPGLAHLALLAQQIINWLLNRSHLAFFAYHYLLTVGASYNISLGTVTSTITEIFTEAGHDVSSEAESAGKPGADAESAPDPTIIQRLSDQSVLNWKMTMSPFQPGLPFGFAGAAMLRAQSATLSSTIAPMRFIFTDTIASRVTELQRESAVIHAAESGGADLEGTTRVRALARIESISADLEQEAFAEQTPDVPRVQLRDPSMLPYATLTGLRNPLFNVGVYAQSMRLTARHFQTTIPLPKREEE